MPPKAVGNAEQTSRVRKRSASAPVRARQDKVADFDFDPAISSAVERRGSAAKRRVEPDGPLSPEMLSKIHRYWQAANYLTVGQIYLSDNPLLREPLKAAHIKPRLLGHWGTSAGQNFIYVHLNRLIKEHEAEVIYISGARAIVECPLLSRGNILRSSPRGDAGRLRYEAAVPAVLYARWRAESLWASRPELHARRR